MLLLGEKFTSSYPYAATALGRYHLLLTSPPSRLSLPFSSISHPRHHTELESSLDFLLQQCSTPRQAKQIHAQLLSSSAFHHPHSGYLSARLVSVYGRLGLLPDARSVFRAAPDRRSSLLWNSILRANLARGHSLEALSLYYEMRALGALPDGFTFPLVIRACTVLGVSRLCSSVHNHTVSMGCHVHLHVANELIIMYGNVGRMDLARQVFDAMPLRNVVSWNTLISGYSRNYDCEAAQNVFRLMESTGFEPNPVTWTALLSAHARCQRHDEVIGLFDKMRAKGGKATAEAVAVALSVYPYVCSAALEKGKEMHSFAIRSGLEGYSFVKNSLICMYGKLGDREDAERLFSETAVKDSVSWNALISSYAAAGLSSEAYEIFARMEKTGEFTPNVVSWSAVIGGFASEGMVEQSLELFRQMQQAGVAPNSVTVATVLSACAELSALRSGKEIHGHTIRGLMDHNLLVANGLLNMYTKSGSLREGQSVFDGMEDKDLISWNSMIAGYGIHGFCDQALGTFSDMVRAGCEPDGITFIALLSACGHSGRVSQGRRLFDRMVDEYKIKPCMEHYSCMVDLLGRAGLLGEASELVECMPMKPNACVWGALLNSCRIYGNTAAAEGTMARILGLEGQATGNYMLLSNIYAACGRWEDSARVRVMTKVKGLKKSPGQSWIEVKNNVYAFSAGSALPPGAEDVYEVLEDLYQHMESDKFAPDARLLQVVVQGDWAVD
uniref:LOW QUALITY PROTEIN: putative pentatricopeptide repeat-containing protein At1g17630 n=1 Tax=Elaeis guineensis var. tenera TaxID=51953 RepID=A0A6I9QU79_ELAGV|nr:LOW QUALITY PROTEIN: putative pentatricopeptide repeat-containing protein At1g17630 [Elaeis guineensis]